MLSTEGAITSSLGLLGGTGAGYLIGQRVGKKTENMALAGAIGGGMGLMAGGLLHEHNMKVVEARRARVREARALDRNQSEIDELRERMYDDSSWGRSEVKPWNQRYWDESYDEPYEGPVGR
jgi:hypothetical protein